MHRAQRRRSPVGQRRSSIEASQVENAAKIDVHPLTPARWPDLEAIFEAKGCSVALGCWCMAYRVSGSASALPPDTTRARVWRAALKALVDAGRPPGLIGYRGQKPVG